ncbi:MULTISPECIES: phosphopantetheine-binding protein [unclassified Kitasatospora]|uniref:acyl carrier protein n=1 Tax=unclassified Kitasatospora TaxID=2633591 RepID=UPI0033F2BB34
MDMLDQRPLDFITSYLAQAFGVPQQELTPEASFSCLALDSIAQVELFVTLSDHYGVHLDDAHATGSLTLQETADLVEAAIADSGAATERTAAVPGPGAATERMAARG